MAEELLYEVKEHAAWLTLNREYRRNAISLEMIELFEQYLDRAEADETVRVLCLTGAGDKAFCAGADLLATLGGGDATVGARRYAALLKRLVAYPKPIVCRLNGHCLAGGMGLMLAADIVYARPGIKIGTPEVNVGLFPMMIGALIFRNALRKKALEMVYTARMYTPEEAEAMGLITRVYAAEEFDAQVERTLTEISAKGPAGIRIGRQAFAAVADLELDEALDVLCGKLGEVLRTEDATEGLSAFMEKREPQWKGR
ncbi:MAG TPA: enoyl-CoA hydratase-related protein [bacterium]|nr:enoyl-CoA hydratase-related protein [bacterium]